jgi:hypothetical protein
LEMKTAAFLLATTLAVSIGFSQTTRPNGTISKAPARDRDNDTRMHDYSVHEISAALRELHRSVEETLPMLNAVTQAATNGAGVQPASTEEEWAKVLGGILRRDTNQTARSTPQNGGTNWLERVLQGVLGTNAAPETAASPALKDLATLRDQLQDIRPILDRLEITPISEDELIGAGRHSETNGLTPTGRD